MSSDHVQLKAAPRTEFGSAKTRRLRKEGLVPGVLYKGGQKAIPFSLPHRELYKALHGSHGKTAVFEISVDGAPAVPALLKDWDLNPVRNELWHVDFHQVDLKVAVQASVPVVLSGIAVGVRDGGVLDQPVHEVTIEALPDAIPDAIEVNVDDLEAGAVLHLADLVAPAGVTIIGDGETVIASITAASRAEAPEGEDVAAEPEIVGGKSDEE